MHHSDFPKSVKFNYKCLQIVCQILILLSTPPVLRAANEVRGVFFTGNLLRTLLPTQL